MKSKIRILLFSMLLFYPVLAKDNAKVGIDEKLDSYLPMDTYFYDEEGNKVELKQLITKPTVLAFVYYDCPGICSPLLNGLSEVVGYIEMEPGKDFNIVTISFNYRDKPADAKRWKYEHLHSMRRKIPENSWHFLTGDSSNIMKITQAAGFYFKPDGKDYLHMGSLIVTSEKGKITRYIFGTDYNPFDLKMAIIEAQKGEARPTINKILAFCYGYDPQGNKYVLNVTKIAAGVLLLFVGIFFSVLIIGGKKKKKKMENVESSKSRSAGVNDKW